VAEARVSASAEHALNRQSELGMVPAPLFSRNHDKPDCPVEARVLQATTSISPEPWMAKAKTRTSYYL